jgi:hypothetical protein
MLSHLSAKLGLKRGGLGLAMSVGLAAVIGPCPAPARPVAIVWSTFLRTGPGSGYQVVDELRHDTVVDLRSCDKSWCQVASGRFIGFIDQDSVSLPRLPSGDAPTGGPQGCFVAGQLAWRKPAATQFCQTQPAHPQPKR